MKRFAALLAVALCVGLAHAGAATPPQPVIGPASGPVIGIDLAKGVTPDDAVQSMQLRANLLNLKQVGDLPVSKQVAAMTGKPGPTIRILLFCNPLVAADIVAARPDFAAYMPCRIALVETAPGHYRLEMMNLAPLIAEIPAGNAKLRAEAEKISHQLRSVLEWGATGRI